MSLRLYFLRHGQTAFSRDNAFCGAGLNPELTEDGQAMAQCFANAYQTTPWRAVYASTLRRTIATAKPLCDAIGAKMELRPVGRQSGDYRKFVTASGRENPLRP